MMLTLMLLSGTWLNSVYLTYFSKKIKHNVSRVIPSGTLGSVWGGEERRVPDAEKSLQPETHEHCGDSEVVCLLLSRYLQKPHCISEGWSIQIHMQSGLNDRHFFQFWKQEVQEESASRDGLLWGCTPCLQRVTLAVYTWSPFCALHLWYTSLCPHFPFPKDSSQLGLGPTLRVLF